MRLTIPNSPITYNLSNFITGCRSLGDKIMEVLLYDNFFVQRPNCIKKFKLFAIQKCIVILRQLAYGIGVTKKTWAHSIPN